jgi:hypothetical protein
MKLLTKATAALLLFLLSFHPAGAQSFPEGDVFRPMYADPFEVRSFISVLGIDFAHGESTAASVGIGTNFGLYRWPGKHPGDGWQVSMFAHIVSQFDLEGDSFPLVNTDFRVGLGLSYREGELSARARLLHQSSHLGDEFLLQGIGPTREDLSVELLDVAVAWERAGWRPYVGASYLVNVNPETLKKWGLQAGVDYAGSTPVLLGGRLEAGLDYRVREQNDWRSGVSAKVGLGFGRNEPQRRGISVFLEFYDGPSPFGQFYSDVISYYGVGLQFHH